MEPVILIIIGGIFVAIRLVRLPSRRRNRGFRPRDAFTEDFARQRRARADGHDASRNLPEPPPPFDSTTSHPVASPRILRGRARIVDGDTIVIESTQIRLFGIDAPEISHPHGKNAKWALIALCKGQTITAEITDEDVHGRMVAKCRLEDGRDLSAEMVKRGLAIDWPKFSGGVYLPMETADARRKLWLADARQKGRMDVWERFEARQAKTAPRD
ncbi:thermonuclease family protein [Seohaeicola zhoushanensis]|uniref:TNase-like domain-containing protein n=1 Tax=Seohaeicola zhoushanensis TaxID=1569283 RepID=A0A8J3M645_9RHOB|nr:thermonuclease family protein [Seohaeicola zhoushanensis]GHF39946.1 hypothetical protein GCM10017056_09380 [Seohaeicola zhoushanensis]